MTPNTFMQFQANAFQDANAFIAKGAEVMQQYVALNNAFAKTTFEKSAAQMQTVIAAKDAKALGEAVTESAKPDTDFVNYINDLTSLSARTYAEMSEMVEAQVSKNNDAVDEVLEQFEKNAPAGSESAVRVMRQSVEASRAAYSQATKASKQFTSVFAPATASAEPTDS
jgi:gas vesicle protein